MRRASGTDVNSQRFRQPSRKTPLKLLLCPFCHGLPGSMQWVSTCCACNQVVTCCAINSGPYKGVGQYCCHKESYPPAGMYQMFMCMYTTRRIIYIPYTILLSINGNDKTPPEGRGVLFFYLHHELPAFRAPPNSATKPQIARSLCKIREFAPMHNP
jgi:hypothetical protein